MSKIRQLARKIKLTPEQMYKATTIATNNNVTLDYAINLMKQRVARTSVRPTMTGSVRRAESYTILPDGE